MACSKEVKFQYKKKKKKKKRGFLKCFLSSKLFPSQKGIFNSVYFQPRRWILITLDSEVQNSYL